MHPSVPASSAAVATPAASLADARRTLTDRLLPALLFGAVAVIGCVAVVLLARRGPASTDLQGWAVFLLGLGHLVLSFMFAALIATLFLIRRSPQGKRAGRLAMTIALGGAFIMNAATFQPRTIQDWRLLALADLLLIGGLAFSIYAALYLRHCFGLAPEARGLVTTGAYRLVRHPLYLGEFVAMAGLLLPVLSPFTLLVYALFAAFQATRMRMEEQVLTAAFPEYAAYRRRTPALLPWPRFN